MDRTLDTIDEDATDLYTSSSETHGDNLPTVTSKQRTFADTVQKQNRENKALREKILRDKIAQLQEELYEQALNYNANDPDAGRHPPEKTANTNTAFTPRAAIPSSPLGLTPRVPRPQDVAYQAALKQRQAEQNKEGHSHSR
jgi:hypothetical protein